MLLLCLCFILALFLSCASLELVNFENTGIPLRIDYFGEIVDQQYHNDMSTRLTRVYDKVVAFRNSTGSPLPNFYDYTNKTLNPLLTDGHYVYVFEIDCRGYNQLGNNLWDRMGWMAIANNNRAHLIFLIHHCEVSSIHSENAYSPMEVTESGMTTKANC